MKTCAVVLLSICLVACGPEGRQEQVATGTSFTLQLNWFHDPTFVGEYRAAAVMGDEVTVVEGGVNISPLQQLRSRLADIAVVGIDIALQAIQSDLNASGTTDLRVVHADFQRNPVGWILHPQVASDLGAADLSSRSGREKNAWLFEQFRQGTIQPGDKRGTETTAVWTQWRSIHALEGVPVTPVGFDPSVVVDAPKLAYPVYLNEEPFRLSELIGTPVVVFDPADDGLELYGNVLVTRADVLADKRSRLVAFVANVREGWHWAQSHPDLAADLVRPLYADVSNAVLLQQIRQTVSFAVNGEALIGVMDTSPGGRLAATISALQEAGTLSQDLSREDFLPAFVETQPQADELGRDR